jgi:hypothetical protein
MVVVTLSPNPDPVLIFLRGGSISSDPRPVVIVEVALVPEEEDVVAPIGDGAFEGADAAFLLLSLLRVL